MTRDETLARQDAEARLDAQRIFDRPVVLQAGAGTGKTTTLVARILAWALGPGWLRAAEALEVPIDTSETTASEADARIAARVLRGIVAITFTEAAAAEMSARIGQTLLAIEGGEAAEGLDLEALGLGTELRARRASALRASLDHLVAQTIHAYCRRLLVGHPLDARVHPRLVIDADERLQSEVVREVLEEALRVAYSPPSDPDFLTLAARGYGPAEIEEELRQLLVEGMTSRVLEADPLGPNPIRALAERLVVAIEALLRASGGCLERVSTGKAAQIVADLLSLAEGVQTEIPESPEALDRLVASICDGPVAAAGNKISDWARGNFSNAEAAELGDRAEGVPGPARDLAALLSHLAGIDVELLACGRRVFRGLLFECEELLRRRGVATFSSLLSGAQDLLKRRPGVAAQLRRKIDQLLVDEFQDTDLRQCDIVRALALEGPAEERPGLFVVGDPKQSIYGWRSADLAAYDAFVADVMAAGGKSLRLSVNYRSAPVILSEVERAIAPVMFERKGIQPPFEPLTARPEPPAAFADGRSAGVEYWVSADWDPDSRAPTPTRSARATQIEAVALARDLRRLHDESEVPWKSFGVLFRGRSDWEIYLRALRSENIPFAVEGDRHYYKRREIIDASALVCCVLDPNDHVSLVSLLRSAAVGVPDAALIPLWTREFPALMSRLDGPDSEAVEEIQSRIKEAARAMPADVPGLDRVSGWEQGLAAAVDALATLRGCIERDPADVFVERLRRFFALEASEAARYAGVWRVANLDRFFRNLAEDLDADPRDVVLRRIRRALAEEAREEEARPVEILEDAVRILTVHGAKGLDFEHVYVMQLHKGRAGTDEARFAEAGEDVAYRFFKQAASLEWDRLKLARREVEEAELVRLLYVAMTRAKQRLVLVGLWPELQSRSAAGQPLALLEARSGARPALAESMIALAASGGDFVDAGDARWVFPVLAGESTSEPDPASQQVHALPTRDDVARDSRALGSAREAAEEHSARPLGGAASAQAEEESREERADRLDSEIPSRPPADATGSSDSQIARALGTAVHRALELYDLDAEPRGEEARRREQLEADLAHQLSGDALERAVRDGTALLGRIAEGSLLARLRQLGPHIVARELPLLAGPEGDTGPVAFVSGAIDLLYTDPESGELIIVDYKTDRLEGESAFEERTQQHARQGAVYQRALREGLDLAYTPHFEIWYLRSDRISRPVA